MGKTLAKFADTNHKIVAITGGDAERNRPSDFSRRNIPTRYFDVGIAEEHAALFACGLATQGLKPFLTIYSTFMQRAYDMIIHDIALQNLNVALCMDRAGLSGDDGPTHHGLSTSAICATSQLVTCSRRMKTNSSTCSGRWRTTIPVRSPFATRAARAQARNRKRNQSLLEIGKAEVVQHGTRSRHLRPGQHV